VDGVGRKHGIDRLGEDRAAAPNMGDAEWALYRVTETRGRGMLAVSVRARWEWFCC